MSALPKLMPIQITSSVGRMARNTMRDVRTVQERLNFLMQPSWKRLVEDGLCGPMTKAVIGDFQSKVLGFQKPDERVDPAARTIKALNDTASANKWRGGTGPLGPLQPNPGSNDPVFEDPISPETMPKIGVIGPTDGNAGFDTFPAPAQILGPAHVNKRVPRDGAWLMVPKGGRRSLRINIDPTAPVQFVGRGISADGSAWSFRREKLLRAEAKGNTIIIHGLQSCKDCRLDIVQNGKHLRLYVSVKPRRVVPLIVFYVDHGPRRNPRFSPKDLRSAIEIANRNIFLPQCNLELKLLDDRILRREEIGHRLGSIIRCDPSNPNRDESKYLAPFVRKATVPQPDGAEPVDARNLFVVREIRSVSHDEPLAHKPIGLHISTGMILIDDRSFGAISLVKDVAETIAHEIGHSLIGQLYQGFHMPKRHWSHNPHFDALMHPAGPGTKIYRIEAEVLNPTGSALMYGGNPNSL